MEIVVLSKVRAAHRHVVVLQLKPHCSLQIQQNAATAAAMNPPPALVPVSALSAPVVDVQHGALFHAVCAVVD